MAAGAAAVVCYRVGGLFVFYVTARQADPEERRAIVGQARKIYAGYEAYARRITGRDIPS
jgi:hypothetical protein